MGWEQLRTLSSRRRRACGANNSWNDELNHIEPYNLHKQSDWTHMEPMGSMGIDAQTRNNVYMSHEPITVHSRVINTLAIMSSFGLSGYWVIKMNILRATPSAVGTHSRHEGCSVVSVLCWLHHVLTCWAGLPGLLAYSFLLIGICTRLLAVSFAVISSHSFHFWCPRLPLWCPKHVFWQTWCLHFGTSRNHWTIQGHLGA